MAKYLRTSGISAELEDLIRNAREKVYIISPYLKLSDSIRELINDKEREKIEVRIIFGKQELNPTEMSFLENLKYVRLYFSNNLHAKCYLNESKMIITSMNLYEFSQQNNREMGILIERSNEEDKIVYDEAWKDIESIRNNAVDFAYAKVNISERNPSTTTQNSSKENKGVEQNSNNSSVSNKYLSTTALSKEIGLSSKELFSQLENLNWIIRKNDDWVLTSMGERKGALIKKGQYGDYIAWPENLINEISKQLVPKNRW